MNQRYELWCDRCGRPIRTNYLATYCTRCAKYQPCDRPQGAT